MNPTIFQKHLVDLCACDEAKAWAKDFSLQQAYEYCVRPDWMLWLAQRMIGKPGAPTLQSIILAGIDCAETALKFVPEGEDRPRKAIEAARICALDPTEENKQVARDAANAAANAAYAAASAANAAYAAASAANAAYAAANAATNATNAANADAYAAANAATNATNAANADAYAANAAYAAANAANAASKEKAQKEMCDLIRKRFDCKF